MKRTDPRHGSPAGYAQHNRDAEKPCKSCARAHADYQSRYRKQNPNVTEYDALLNKARNRALSRLAQQHRDDYLRLYAEEKRHIGITP